MATKYRDRVRETSTTSGTGTLTLDGSVTGYQTFDSALGIQNGVPYLIVDRVTSEWEVGLGSTSGGTALTRDRVLASSNSNQLVNLAANNVKDVMSVLHADRFEGVDASCRRQPPLRLTLASGNPFVTADQSAKSTLYYSPAKGDALALYSTTFDRLEFFQVPEFAGALGTLTDATNYDVFCKTLAQGPSSTDTTTEKVTFSSAHGILTGSLVRPYYTGGGLTAGTWYFFRATSTTEGTFHTTLADALAGTNAVNLTGNIGFLEFVTLNFNAWSSSTARATDVTLQNGRYCLSGSPDILYAGTMRTTSTTTTEDSETKRFLWNMYHRQKKTLLKVEHSATSSWTYNSATVRPQNNDANNCVEAVFGLETTLLLRHDARMEALSGAAALGTVGIGKDSTTTNITGSGFHRGVFRGPDQSGGTFSARYHSKDEFGYHKYTALENAPAGTVTFYGNNLGTFGLRGRFRG